MNALNDGIPLEFELLAYGGKRDLSRIKQSPDKARNIAKQILIKTGVLTKTGKSKDTIVSWE